MAIFHLSAQAIQRSSGRSAAACAAYRSGEKIHDPRQGLDFEYSRRSDRIVGKYVSEAGKESELSRQELWSKVETHHKRKDACIAREIEVALPHEIEPARRIQIAKRLSDEISKKYGVAVDCCIHTSEGDGQNWHAHLLCTSATISNGTLGKKAIDFDPHECGKAGKEKPVEAMRPWWADFLNHELERAGVKERVDHRTLEAQGIDRVPQIHVGPKTEAGHNRRKERNETIKATNAELKALKAELAEEQKQEREAIPKFGPWNQKVINGMLKEALQAHRDYGIDTAEIEKRITEDPWQRIHVIAALENERHGMTITPTPEQITILRKQISDTANIMADQFEKQQERNQQKSLSKDDDRGMGW